MSSKAFSGRPSPLASQALKVVGVVITLAALLDILVLPIPYQPLDRQWQISFVTQVVDRGIVPLVGLALILTSYWLDGLVSNANRRGGVFDLRFWALLLASLLGLFYVLAIPLHLNNVRVVNREALTRIETEATQAESQLGSRLDQEVQQQRAQINQLLSNEELLNQAVQAGQVTQEQASLIQQFQDDPNALDQFINQRVEQLQTQFQTEIGVRREEAQSRARNDSLKLGLRIGLGSLLLAIAYIFIGWTGLRSLSDGS